MSIESAIEHAAAIKYRLMTPEGLRWLAEQAASHRAIVNVGVWTGASARALAEATEGTLVAVDPWTIMGHPFDSEFEGDHAPPSWLFDTYVSNMGGLTNIVSYRGTSMQAVAAMRGLRFDMVYIDGNHEYPYIREDIAEWRKLLLPGALLSGHDYAPWGDWGQGVIKAVDELLPDRQLGPDSIWFATIG